MNNFIFVLLNIFFAQNCFSQQLFLRNYGDTIHSWEWASGLALTPDSGFMFYGAYNSLDSGIGFIGTLKTDFSGNEIFNNHYYLQAQSFVFFDNNNLIRSVTNKYYGGGTAYTNFSSLSTNAVLAKYDVLGDTEFVREYNMGYRAIIISIKQLHDSNLIVTGYFQQVQAVNGDMFVMKLDTNGNILWQQNYGIIGWQEEGHDIMELPNNDLVVTGIWNENLTITQDTPQTFLMKLDSAGNQIWFKEYTTNTGSYAEGLQLCTDGGYIVSGFSYVMNHFDYTTMLLRTDSAGDSLWTKSYRLLPQKHSGLVRVQLDSHGGYVATGFAVDSDNLAKGLLLKYDEQGNFLWEQHYADSGIFCQLSDLKVLPDSGFVMCGTINQAPGGGRQDYVVIRTDSLGCYQNCWTGTGVFNLEEQKEVEISIYPNPFTNKIFFHPSFSSNEKISITLLNSIGEKLFQKETTMRDQEINLTSFPTGIIFLTIKSDKIYFTKKIVKK